MARSCWSSDLSIACSVAAAARFGRESEAGREGIICRSQTPHTPPHTLRTSLAGKPVINSRSLDAASDSHWPSRPVGGEVRAELQPRRRPREPICRGRGAGVGERARRGRGREAERGAARGGHARGGGGGSREQN